MPLSEREEHSSPNKYNIGLDTSPEDNLNDRETGFKIPSSNMSHIHRRE